MSARGARLDGRRPRGYRCGMLVRSIMRVVAVAFILGSLSGCVAAQSYIQDLFLDDPADTPQAYYERGMQKFEDEFYAPAIDYFEKVITRFPYSKYATLAELRIGESYFLDERYGPALLHLEEFERRHPRHERIEYVLYLAGMSYLKQIPTVDRTPVMAERSVERFDKLIDRFPEGQFAEEARPLRDQARAWLAEHTLMVGVFYYRDAEYWATWGRTMDVLENYRGLGQDERALYYLGKAYFFEGQWEKAEEVFRDHQAHFPDSEHDGDVEFFLAEIRDGDQSGSYLWRRFKERVFFDLGYE